jgi:hypothetical protein
MDKKRRRDEPEDEEVDLLCQSMAHDVWSVIEENLNVLDMLVLCVISRATRRFVKSRLKTLPNGLFCCSLNACRWCGHHSYAHRCAYYTPRVGHVKKCETDALCVIIPGANLYTETYRLAVYSISSISLISVNSGTRKAYIRVSTLEPIPYNWGIGLGSEGRDFWLSLSLSDAMGVVVYEAYHGTHQANGIYVATLCTLRETSNRLLLRDRLIECK